MTDPSAAGGTGAGGGGGAVAAAVAAAAASSAACASASAACRELDTTSKKAFTASCTTKLLPNSYLSLKGLDSVRDVVLGLVHDGLTVHG